MEERLQGLLAKAGLTDPQPLTETGIARLWTARDAGGARRVVKIYRKGHLGNEAPGIALMQHWRGSGACVPVRSACEDAIVMDWLDGPLLGDRSRAGADLDGCAILGRLAARLHRAPLPHMPDLPRLEDWFAALFALDYAPGCPPQFRRDMGRAADLARVLLADAPPLRPLHGDLHHDNVIETARGPVALDAKGVLADPAYELANAMRNPKGCAGLLRDPDHMRARLAVLAREAGLSQTRLAGWSAAKCALSIAWQCGGRLERNDEDRVLAILLRIADPAQ